MQIRFTSFSTALLAASVLVTSCSTTKHDVRAGDKPMGAAGDHAAMQLPPGWTAEDMQVCMAAATPGPMHEFLQSSVGTWKGKSTMWMAPGMAPTESESVCTTTSEMDGRYTKAEYKGEMPGMGAFHGLGYNGFDNVAQKFVSTWIDNMGTGMMVGEGVLSADKKTLTWNFRFNCPMLKGPATMREVEHHPNADTMTLEMFGPDPKSGREYKMMHIDLKRQSGGKAGS